MERLAPPSAFLSQLKTVSVGNECDPRALISDLIQAGYERCDQLEGPGQCSQRGDILDVYPPQASYPFRIEFFGDEIDQIRIFDPLTQRSIEQRSSDLFTQLLDSSDRIFLVLPASLHLMKSVFKL